MFGYINEPYNWALIAQEFRTWIGHRSLPQSRKPLTKQFCEAAKPPEKGNRLYRCGQSKGLALRVTANGARSFVFCYSTTSGRERRMTIGQFGTWTVGAARKRSVELRRMVDMGVDPLEAKQESRLALSVRELWGWYSRGPLKHLSPASRRDIAAAWRSKIEPRLGANTKLEQITRSDIQRLVDLTTETSGPVTANRVHSYIRRILKLAAQEGFISSNPASENIRRNTEHAREHYLSKKEVARLFDAIDEAPIRRSALAVKLLMLTGARKSEVLGMRWEEIDFEKGVWSKPPTRTKQRTRHRIPLSEEAMSILVDLRATSDESLFVFPSDGASGHVTDIKRTWKWLRKKAELGECRLHDLRHTYASLVASGGGSLEIIGALLGHSQVQTTKRYAHLFDQPLRAATEIVSNLSNGKE